MKRITNFSLVVFSLLVAVLAGEVILQIIGFSYPNFYRYDVHAKSRLREGAEGWYKEEGKSCVRINRHGMRDNREISIQKTAESYRIAVLGDSYAEAMQLPVENSFSRVLEGKLNECNAFGKKKVEVLNFGVSGYSTAQELQTLRHRVWQFQPDLVLLAFLSGNDVRDNSEKLTAVPGPYFIYRDDQLVLDDSFRNSRSFKLKSSAPWLMFQKISNYSRIIQLINKVRSRIAHSNTPRSEVNPGYELGLDYNIYFSPPRDPDWENAWRVTEGLILQMRNEVVARGAKFVVVTLSNGIQVHPDHEVRAGYARRLGVADLFYPERRIKALGEREGLHVISLAETFQKHAEENQVYLHGFPNAEMLKGHWNENAHRLAGSVISENLCKAKP